MKVTIARDAAHAAFAKARRTMPRKADMQILGTVLLSAYGNAMTVSAADFDRRITIAIAAEVEEPGEICVEGKTLGDALKHWPEGERVTINHPLAEGDTRCVVSCVRNRVRIGTLPAEDFPEIERGSADIAFEMAGADLARAIELCLPHACDDGTRHYLHGVAIGEDRQGDLVFVATNGHTLLKRTLPIPDDAGGLTLRIIPTEGATEIAKVAADRKAEPVELAFSDRAIHMNAGDTTYTALLIDGTYPDYEAIIPRDFARSVMVYAGALAGAAERAGVVLKGKATGIALHVSAEEILVKARHADAEAESEADAVYDGPEFVVGVNVDYLRDCLAPIGAGEAALSFQADAASPIVITAEGLPGVTAVLMPVRLPQ
ncbi:DNA polymerase III subunit beta [Pleomorphomonas sp. JP5]|uniref:DNA polymerase III subunit beta n=1 Tax=Pleomorphomonas sp. JP5 TaxID=2942998 RepID=UPI002042EB40|nr:DNA polymerase III subunit beta [Pleomorphomonas sp. JP5]MCM5556310.1 DNA polymerase III subunit beta [Pleomorphomonas sp. JP5]